MNDDDFFIKLHKVFDVLDRYKLIIDIEYFNTFSFKMMYEMFFNKNIKSIQWVFEVDDEDTVFKGDIIRKELKSNNCGIDFVFIKKK